MANENKIRVGLIGCGYQGQLLARAAEALDDFELVAGVDPDPTALAKTQAIAGGIQIEKTVQSLVTREDVDAVFVATPHNCLQPYAMQAVNAGKHVLAEKPLALNAQEAAELETAVNRAGVTYMAGYSFRYFSPVIEAKRFIDEGIIGPIQTISAGMAVPGIRDGWPSDPQSGGGFLGFYGCHIIDRVLWFVNDHPIQVSASVTYDAQRKIDLTTLFELRFANGVVAQFNLCASSFGWFDFAHINGRDGHIHLALQKPPNYSLTVSSRLEGFDSPQTLTTELERSAALQQVLVLELTDFAQAVRSNSQPPITIADGRLVLEIIDTIKTSSEIGQPVQLGSL